MAHALSWRLTRLVAIVAAGAWILLATAGGAGARLDSGAPVGGSTEDGEFMALDARTSSDVWAAGWQASGSAILGLVRHYDGRAWNRVDVPAGLGEAKIKGVVALSPNDVWMVGQLWGQDEAFSLHWDGTRLTQISVPDPGLMSSLNGIAASPTGDVWAVGDYTDWLMPHKVRSLVVHWNGAAWQVVPSPNLDQPWYNELTTVRAFGPNDVWAAGWSDYQPIVMRWNGSAWAFDQTVGGQEYDMFNALAGRSSSDLYAIGSQHDYVAKHWNGSQWTGVGTQAPFLFGASTVAPSFQRGADIWAVGTDFSSNETVAVHIKGDRWTRTPTPSPGGESYGNILYAVDALGPNDVWASGSGDSPMIVRWRGEKWGIAYR